MDKNKEIPAQGHEPGAPRQEEASITVCIPTYKRPGLLERLLNGIAQQETGGRFAYRVLVVDNDTRQSALPIVERARKRLEIDIAYRTEPEQNIALARNAAVKYSGETDIAFIDDDEVPDKRWLLNLWKTLSQSEADGVLGPVRPFFPEGCPAWVAASGLCERPSHATGSVLEVGDCRTGNVLLRRRLFKDGRLFGPEFGRTGGEDAEFFKACIEAGSQFIWCDMAVARETVPPERWTVRCQTT